MAILPNWSTPQRRDYLVELFYQSNGFCVYGEERCTVEEHNYAVYIEDIIDTWKAEDRDRVAYLWRLERETMHDERGRWGSRFDPVSRDVFMATRPEYYLVGMGLNPLTFNRVAMVRIPSTFNVLFVDVSEAVQGMSKNIRRKAKRYGHELPEEAMLTVDTLCKAAVRDWWLVKP